MDNWKKQAYREALEPLAKIPVEAFGKQNQPEYPLMGWNGHVLYVKDVLRARAVLESNEAKPIACKLSEEFWSDLPYRDPSYADDKREAEISNAEVYALCAEIERLMSVRESTNG